MSKTKRTNAPLRSRVQITKFLRDHTNYYRHLSTSSPIAWNVKDHDSDLSFENLVAVHRKGGNYGDHEVWLDSPEYLAAARQKYDEVEKDLWSWAIENCQDNVKSYDSYKTLANGTELDVEYEFHGRSGGWLLMTKFEGYDLTRAEPDFLDDWDYDTLRKLYLLVVQNDHDFRPEAVKEEIEYQAASDLFENVCRDIPRPDKLQMTLNLD